MDNVDEDQDALSDPEAVELTVQRVLAYVRGEPGAWASLAQAARDEPEATTRALLTLGTVLLDISAGAFALSPAEMLEKVSGSLARSEQDQLHAMAQQ